MENKRTDSVYAGERFGKWLVLDRARGANHSKCFCVCDCGTFSKVFAQHLKNKKSNSCLKCAVFKHGLHDTKTYKSWIAMHERCGNPNIKAWRYYGGKGVIVCPEWSKFENFLTDMGPRPEGLSLDRIDSSGNYEPGNCRWADSIVQGNNRCNVRKIEYKGREYSVIELANHLGIKRATLESRLRKGGRFDLPLRNSK